MITDCLYRENFFLLNDNDFLDEESLNKMFSHLYQKEYIKEEIKNEQNIINNNCQIFNFQKNEIKISNNTLKDENLNKFLFSKKENINEEKVDSKIYIL